MNSCCEETKPLSHPEMVARGGRMYGEERAAVIPDEMSLLRRVRSIHHALIILADIISSTNSRHTPRFPGCPCNDLRRVWLLDDVSKALQLRGSGF